MYLLAQYKDKSVAIFHVEYIEYDVKDECIYFYTVDDYHFKINIPKFERSFAYDIINKLFKMKEINIMDNYGNMFVEQIEEDEV